MTSVEVKRVLNTLLRDPENHRCGDCKVATHPRWASWSLGVFVCIKCAGFHRSMGTHITKVKSVDLDTWTEEHLAAVLKYGNNKKFNEHYENKLGGGTYVPDQSKLGQFIRTKYELKKWVGDDPIEQNAVPAKSVDTKGITSQQNSHVADKSSESLWSSDSDVSSASGSMTADATEGFIRKDIPQKPTTVPVKSSVYTPSDRPDLKKSILSLYANPRSSPQSRTQSPSQSSLHLPTRNGNNNSGLNGMQSQNPWVVPRGIDDTASRSSLSLDDDLFKNVWT